MNRIDQVLRSIEKAYGSLEEPSFKFVEQARQSKRYQELILGISKICSATEDTDENDDVSFGYMIESGAERFVVRLSMVGPYFIVLELRANGSCSLVTDLNDMSKTMRQVVDFLHDSGLQMLDEVLLLHPVGLTLSNTEFEDTCVFQALFTDTAVIPWRALPVPM